MRPLRLMLDGFGSYRERTEVDLSDVDFFVLTGPTGSGKSTVIDALCFALYGTVPRWGKGNVIRNALAPSAAECRVCLVFDAAGGRYAAARQLRRDARGQVHTKEARLDRLDDRVPRDAELTAILQASVEQVAEGPDQVSAEVAALLGIGYEHFTQCVLLPQGRFAEFLHAKPGDRQDLLIQLLAYAVYEDVGQRARERARLAASRLTMAEQRLGELGEVTDEALGAAQRRVAILAGLAPRVDSAVDAMAELRVRWTEASQRAGRAREQLAEVAAVRMPDEVSDLSARLTSADRAVERCAGELSRCADAEAAAERDSANLTDASTLHRWRDAYRRQAALRDELATLQGKQDAADEAERVMARGQSAAETAVTKAESALAAAEQAHRAVTLAADLCPGQPCPVCHQRVGEIPHHDVPADLHRARAAVTAARSALAESRSRHAAASRAAAATRAEAGATQRHLAELASELHGAPPATDADTELARRQVADAAVERARAALRTVRASAEKAQRDRADLHNAEQRAWSAFRAGRDRFVALGAPAVDGADLAEAWRTLLSWAQSLRGALTAQAAELDEAEADLRASGTRAADELTALLGEHGVRVDNVQRAPVILAEHRERAARDLADLRTRRERSAAATAEVRQCREDREVADMLGNLLRSDGFERWLCAEALDSLVLEASAILMHLSGGQYELYRGARNDLVVADHNDAGTQRPVNTLSGGETFQASLALALALSHQVTGLSGGRRDLNSMFLDEGFGTLDESTLDTVAATLERLSLDTDRMVGIITHVPALAERVPVQFVVSRDGASSRLRRVPV
jgi:exonuclease SbcC